MVDRSGKDRAILRLTHEKLNDILSDMSRYPRLVPHEHIIRKARDYVQGAVAQPASDFQMHTTALDGMSALVDDIVHMPRAVTQCIAITVLSYASEELVHFYSVRAARALTDDEQHYCKDKLLPLLDRLKAIVATTGSSA